MNNSVKSGDLRIETLRGIAIIAVVWGHATLWLDGIAEQQGLQDTLIYQFADTIKSILQPLRMPLFTVLSGWVYAVRPATSGQARRFAIGKFRRIILPLFFISTLTYFQFVLVNDDYPVIRGAEPTPVMPDQFWMLWFFRFAHLWFLQALVFIFLCAAILDLLGWMNTLKQWLFWVALTALLPYVPVHWEFWSMIKVHTIMVFFFVGVGIHRFHKELTDPRIIKSAWVLFGTGMLVHLLWKFGGLSFPHWPHFLLIGALGPISLLSMNWVWQPLVFVGGYSYTIYLYHGLAFETHQLFDTLLEQPHYQVLWFVLVVFSGLFIPIFIDRVISRVRYLRTPALGKKP
jgi:peptidoglycan/LPS O-acetylase OafA/YrhL